MEASLFSFRDGLSAVRSRKQRGPRALTSPYAGAFSSKLDGKTRGVQQASPTLSIGGLDPPTQQNVRAASAELLVRRVKPADGV
jgi:hypothetical protein